MNEWKNVPDDIEPYLGFVYRIENLYTNKYYIGQKKFWKIDRRKVKIKPNKQERERLERYKIKDKNKYKDYKQKLKEKYKDRFKTKLIKKETDWKDYWSSSSLIKDDLKGIGAGHYIKEILYCCESQSELSIKETNEQIQYYLKGEWDKLYNECINLRMRIR